MKIVKSEMLEHILAEKFKPNATTWMQATDEVREMCREARILANVPDADAVDFRLFSSPAQWNTQGVAATVKFYNMLDSEGQQQFCDQFESLLTTVH